MTSIHGVNPKRWFYALKTAFAERDAWTVFSGAACEQWINAELFRIVVKNLNSNLTAYTEAAKIDLTIHKVETVGKTKKIDWKNPLVILENKVIYENYYPSRRKNYFFKLIDQLRAKKNVTSECQRIGFYIGIYANWSLDKKHIQTKGKFDEFRKKLGEEFQSWTMESFGEFKINYDHKGCMETLLEFKTIKNGGISVDVGAVGQYFRLSK